MVKDKHATPEELFAYCFSSAIIQVLSCRSLSNFCNGYNGSNRNDTVVVMASNVLVATTFLRMCSLLGACEIFPA